MKKPLRHFLTIAAAVSASIAHAQDTPGAFPPAGEPPRETQPPRDRPPLDPDGARPRDDERRPDGPRPPRSGDFGQPGRPGFYGGPPDREGLGDRFRALPAKLQPFLGVATAPLDPGLSAQLGFTPGLGLLVEEVVPNGPAAKAGVQPLDVIKMVNDQLVSNPPQLAALARYFGKDSEVTLLVLRRGQEQKLSLRIGERLMRDPAAVKPEIFGGMGLGRPPLERRGEGPRRTRDDTTPPRREPRNGQSAPPQKPSADLFREVGPGGAPEVQLFQDRVSTTWNTASARVMLKDTNGEIEVRSENGKRTLTAKNAKGETVFDGPIDTDEQRKGIPDEFRKMLDQVEARSRVDRRPANSHAEGGVGHPGQIPGEPEGPRPRQNLPPDVQ